ncbi:hypothetical protein ASD83_02320 [Devosia sp. Root685]|nr:hypothetical protein ASD83_02320 [Devosia sp. Root685]
MLVIGVVALIVIGPKDMPVVMGRIGKFVGQIRRMGNEFQREINRTTGLDEVRNLRNSITSPLKKTAEEIRKEFNTMTPSGPQPSGAIKPADPKVESVVDELRSAAGMPPAEKKSSDELAADYGFKASEPVKAAKVVRAKSVAAAPTSPVTTSDLAPIEPAKAKPSTAKKTAPATKAASAKTAATKKPAAPKVVATTEVVAPAKPVRKPRTKAAVAEVVAEPVAPVKKPRAPRKKPTDSAETK